MRMKNSIRPIPIQPIGCSCDAAKRVVTKKNELITRNVTSPVRLPVVPFMEDGRVHDARFRSFERYCRSISDPEIVRFDELYERVRLVLSAEEGELPGPG